MASRARAQSLATVLVLELVDAVFRIRLDYEHRFAEHEHDFSAPFQNRARSFSRLSVVSRNLRRLED